MLFQYCNHATFEMILSSICVHQCIPSGLPFCIRTCDHRLITRPLRGELSTWSHFSLFSTLPAVSVPSISAPSNSQCGDFSGRRSTSFYCLSPPCARVRVGFHIDSLLSTDREGGKTRDYSGASAFQSRSQSIRGQHAWLI